MRPLALLLLVAGCGQDYDLTGKRDDEGTDGDSVPFDPGDPSEDFSDLCEGLEGTRHPVSLNPECEVELQTGSFEPVVKFHHGNQTFCGPPAVGPLVDTNSNGMIDDGDLPAILLYQGGYSGSSIGKVVALKGDNSGTFWTTAQGFGQDGGFAVGDLDGDGWPEVVTAGTSSVSALDGRTGATRWTVNGLSRSMDPLGYNYPLISDMEHDGSPEVIVGNAIIDGASGTLVGQGRGEGKGAAPYGGNGASGFYGTLPAVADIDRDGREELITGSHAYHPDGSVKWDNGGLDGLIALADFDLDGEAEIVKTSGIYVTGMETDGTEVWGPVTYAGNLGAPAVDDLDGDSYPDIVFAAQNELIALEWGGTEKWTARISDQSGAAGPVLFDFELDGYPEVLYADETEVRFFSGLDGRVKYSSAQHGSYTILETPIVADVDNDEHVEIILGHCSWNNALTVYGDAADSWPPGRELWNQHAYSITNVGDLGTIPVAADPNWLEYNSFRSGDVGAPPGDYHDLQVEIFDVCESECDDGRLYVGAWVANAGNLEAPAGIPVSVHAGWSGTVLATQYTTAAIPSGEVGEALVFELDPEAVGEAKPVAFADLDGAGVGIVYECDEANNGDDWGSSTCN